MSGMRWWGLRAESLISSSTFGRRFGMLDASVRAIHGEHSDSCMQSLHISSASAHLHEGPTPGLNVVQSNHGEHEAVHIERTIIRLLRPRYLSTEPLTPSSERVFDKSVSGLRGMSAILRGPN